MTLILPTPSEDRPENLLEREIQLFLSQNLHLLAIEGLALIQMERAVPFGRIDILARTRSGSLVVIETKRGRASREDVGQLQSYMGAIQIEMPHSSVQGVLVASGLTSGAEAALVVARGVTFFSYQIHFSFQPSSRWEAPVPPPSEQPQRPPQVKSTRERRYCVYCRMEVTAQVQKS